MGIKKNIDAYVAIVGVLLCIIITSFIKTCNDNALHKNGKITTAIVERIYTIRYAKHFQYVFSVNGKIFSGDDVYYSKTDSISVGDSLLVIYNISDPSQNQPIWNISYPSDGSVEERKK